MTNDLMKLMGYIDSLQSVPTPEPVVEVEETNVHPLLQAMQELKEDGIIESVDAHTIYSDVQSGHREPDDFIEGDIGDRIYWFDDYKLSSLPISTLNLDEHYVDDYLVDDYVELIKSSPNTMPPIVFDPIANSIIDGIHRANAYAKLGYDTIPAYVGLTKSDSYGKREGIDEAKESIKDQIEKAIIMDGGNLSDYFIRSSTIDKIGYSIKQIFGRSPDVGDPGYDIDYVGHGVGKPALWFYPASYYLKQDKAFAQDYPYVWLVKLKPNAWLQPVNKFTKSKQDAPEGKERVGILKNKLVPAAIFFKPAFEVVDKFVDFSKQHKRHGEVKGPQVDEEIVEEPIDEASPNTLEGSFTPDLVESKTWLAKMLAKGLKGKNAGTIYILGSWYGNMGIFLQQEDIKFDKLVLIEPNEEWLMQSKDLLDTLNDEGKLVLIHQKAEDVVYEKPGVVINTSCNETGPVFLTKLPDNMLCLLQARNNVDNVLIETDNLEEFKDLFPLNKIYYAGEKHLTDPETDYTRYMIIGRTGKSQENGIDE